MKYKKLTLLAIAGLHLVILGIHGYSHIVANVQISSLQWIFILLVITIAPLAAVYITWRGNIRKGAGIFALSMLSAFLFGYTLHFVLNSPDLHSNVIGEFNNFFFHSALNLAIIESVGFVFGAYVFAVSFDQP